MALQHLRSGTAHKRPIPSVMSAGQLAINTNEASPGLFFKDSNGDLVKVGPVHIGTDAPNSSPASVAATALVTGTVYQILTVGTSDFTLVGASANTVGTIFTATGTTTGDGTVSGQQGVQKGEQWLDTTGGTYVLKIYDGTAWRSESGTFVDANGDTMTGPLILPSGTAAAPALGVGSTDNGLYSPGTDQVAISTNGSGRLFIDSSGRLGVGTTSPQAQFVISNSGAQGIEAGYSAGTSTNFIQAYNRSSSAFVQLDVIGNPLVFKTGSGATEQLRIDSSGNVQARRSRSNTAGNVALSVQPSDSTIHYGFRIDSANNHFNLDRADNNSTLLTVTGTGAVGIGNTAPGAKLQIEGTSDQLKLTYTSIASYIHEVHSNGDYSIAKDSSERLRIDSSGNVGIGTTSPTVLLDLESTSPIIKLTDSDATGTPECHISGAGGDLLFEADRDNEKDDSLIRFTVDGSERLRIDSSGNVGINTTSPNSLLEVRGTSDGQNVLHLSNSAGSADGGAENQIRVTCNGNTNWGNLDIQAYQTIFTQNGSERMRIDNSGNVGIGVSSPSTKLQLPNQSTLRFGDSAAAPKADISYSSTGFEFLDIKCQGTTNGYGNIRFYTNSTPTERMLIDSSGRVGIGTSSPNNLLDVRGDSNPQLKVSATNTGTNSAGLYIENQGQRNWQIWADRSSDQLRIGHNSRATTVVTVTDTKVGIGDLNPAAKLEVQGSDDANNFIVGASNTNFAVYNDASTGEVRLKAEDGSGSNFAKFLTFHTHPSGSGAAERMRIDSSGNVGIGTSNPVVPLHVIGNQKFEGDMDIAPPSTSTEGGQITLRNPGGSTTGATLDVSASDVLRLFQLNNNSIMELGQLAGTGGFIKFVTEASERLRITSSGNVAIGTTSPGGKLHVVSAANTATFLASGEIDNPGYPAYGFDGQNLSNGTRGAGMYLPGDGVLAFSTHATERLRIDSNGNVGINNASPVAPLDVLTTNGRLFVREDQNDICIDSVNTANSAFDDLKIRVNNLLLQYGGTERMRIDGPSGRVGVGTSDIDGQLEVRSSGALGIISRSTNTQATNGNKAFRARNNSGTDTFTVSYRGQGYFGAGLDVQGDNVTLGPANTTQQYQGLTLKNGKDSSAATTTSYIDFRNNIGTVDGHLFCDHLTDGSSNLLFGTTPAGARDSDRRGERMRITGSGHVFINQSSTATPGLNNTNVGAAFESVGGSGSALFVSRSNGTTVFLNVNGNYDVAQFRRSGTQVGSIGVTTTSTSYNTSSDYRLKENVVDLDGAIDRVKQLAPKRFNFIADADTTVDGFLAHEAQTVVPEAVTGAHNEVDDDGNAVMQGIDQSKLVPLLTAALQEAIAKIETLEQRLTDAGL